VRYASYTTLTDGAPDTSIHLSNNNFSTASVQEIDDGGIVLQNQLSYPTPNPCNTYTSLIFQLESTGLADLSVFDLSGRLVSTIVSENLSQGDHRFFWNLTDENGSSVPAGIYCVRLISGSFSKTQKLLILR
jgi:hypothetical protein